jgi:hypothetical protein
MKISIRELAISAAIAAPLMMGGVAHGAVFPSSPGRYIFPDGSLGYQLASQGGVINPGVLVGFNPQPDPPGAPPTFLDLSNPLHPELVNASVDGAFRVEFALEGVGDGSLPTPAAPNSGGRTGLQLVVGNTIFDITFSTGPGPVDPASWGGFNPQPIPPGDVLGIDYQFAVQGDPDFSFGITENGVPLSFMPAPEPATWAMLLVGFGGLGAVMRRARPKPVAAAI